MQILIEFFKMPRETIYHPINYEWLVKKLLIIFQMEILIVNPNQENL